MAELATSSNGTSTVISADSGKISLGNLADAVEILQGFANEPLDGVTAAKIVKLSRWARPHHARYIAARAVEAEKYGEPSGEGKFTIKGAEKTAEFIKAMTPIRAEMIELDPAMKIDVKMMTSMKISPLAIISLEPFLTGM